jgi:Tfp pilus assembly protein PilN
MKTVNLLPPWYIQQHRRNSFLRLHLAIMVALGAGMLGANWVGQQRVSALNHRRDELARQLTTIHDPAKDLTQAQNDLRRLEDLRLARKELGNTVPMSAVVQQLRNDMTPGMALSDVAVDVRSEPVKGSGVVGDARNPPRYRDVAHLNIMGIAPNDRPITDFIVAISKNPLFAGVTLDFIRTGNLNNYTVRKFEIQIDMDMELLSAEDPADAVASAAPATPAEEPLALPKSNVTAKPADMPAGDSNEH